MLPVIGHFRPWTDPTITGDRSPADACAAGVRAIGGRSTGRGRSSCSTIPTSVPEAAITGDRPASDRSTVPGNWTMQDTGDHPHYTNVQMPFPGPPPALPERNHDRRVPHDVHRAARLEGHADRAARRAAPRACTRVYVNGASPATAPTAGCRASTTSPHRRRRQANDLAIVVVRYSAGSYVEDQDQWWMAGLHRSVHVESRPAGAHRRRALRRRLRPGHRRRAA